MKKRILAMFLSIVMVLGLLPTSALAAETPQPRKQGDVHTYTANITFESADADTHFTVDGDVHSRSQVWTSRGGIFESWEKTSTDETVTITITADQDYVLNAVDITSDVGGVISNNYVCRNCVSKDDNFKRGDKSYALTFKAPDANTGVTGNATGNYTVTVTATPYVAQHAIVRGDDTGAKVTVGGQDLNGNNQKVNVPAGRGFDVAVEPSDKNAKVITEVKYNDGENLIKEATDQKITLTLTAGEEDGTSTIAVTEADKTIKLTKTVYNYDYPIDQSKSGAKKGMEQKLINALVDRENSITCNDEIVAEYKVGLTWPKLGADASAAFLTGNNENIRFAVVNNTFTDHYYSDPVAVTMVPYTAYTLNVTGAGDVTASDDGWAWDEEIKAYKNYTVTGTSTFTAVPDSDYEVTSMTAKATDGTEATVNEDTWSVELAHDKVWTVNATFAKSAVKRFVDLTVSNGTVNGNTSGQMTLSCDEQTLTLAPANDSYALKSVVLDGVDVTDKVVDNKLTLDAVSEDNGNVTQSLTVTFAEKTLVLLKDSVTYKYAYGEAAADVIGDKAAFASKLIEDMVDPNGSFPALIGENKKVSVEYLAGKNVLQEEQWRALSYEPGTIELMLHSFGKNATESIRFIANGKTKEATVTFSEQERPESSIVVAQPLTMTYTPNATVIADVLYSNIDWTNSVLPASLKQNDFTCYYQCDLSEVVSSLIGVDISNGINIPGTAINIPISTDLSNIWVNTNDGSTIGEALKGVKVNVPALGEKNLLQIIQDDLHINVSSEILNQPITPYAGESRNVKVTWDGDNSYKGSEWTGVITITKAPAELDVVNTTITYPEATAFNDMVVVTSDGIPANINKLVISVGLSANVGEPAFVSVQLPNGALYDAVEALFPNGFTLKDISTVLEMIGQTVDNDALNQILDVIPDAVKNFTVHLGEAPKNVGVYLVGGVTIDPNYETAYDVGLLTILPQTGAYTAEFDYSIPTVMTPSQLTENKDNFGGHVVNTSGEPVATPVAKSLILGTTLDGQFVYKTDLADMDKLAPGAYTQVLHVDSFNELVEPAIRVFSVLPRDTNVSIDVSDASIIYGDVIPDMITTSPENLGHIDIYAGVTAALNGTLYLDGEGKCFEAIKAAYPDGFQLSEMSGVLTSVGQPFSGDVMQQIENLLHLANVVGNPKIEYVKQPLDAGLYAVIGVVADNSYYPTADLGWLTVQLKDGAHLVQFDNQCTFTYNGQPQSPKAVVINGTTGNKLENAKISYTYNFVSASEPSNVGIYTVTATWYDFNHYPIIETVKFKIVPAKMTITMDNFTKCVGTPDPAEFTYTTTGDEIDIPITVSREPGEEIGDYTITASVPKSKNYNVTVVDGTLTIQNHAWDDGVVTTDPTCETTGVKTYTCQNDGSHTYTETVAALGHAWGNWTTTKPATLTEDGEETRTCATCGETETRVIPATGTAYTVTFDANGGTMDTATAYTGKDGKLTALPSSSRSGYTFQGWFTEKNGGTKITMDTVFAADTTVYAQWIKEDNSGSGSGGSEGGGSHSTYTLKYDTNGGSQIDSITRPAGTVIALDPYVPTREGYTFNGWYADKSITERVTSVTLTRDITIYAGWTFNGALNAEDHVAYVHGYTDGTVGPERNITRAETAMILYRLLTPERSAEITVSTSNFPDVDIDAWYGVAACSMAKGGYITGYSDGTFGGDRQITRAEFITMLVRFIGTSEGSARFSDVPNTYWAYDFISTATAAGWIDGYSDGTFGPEKPITRAEVMTIVNRVLNRGVDENSELLNCKVWPDNKKGTWYYYDVLEATNAHEYIGSRPSENWTNILK